MKKLLSLLIFVCLFYSCHKNDSEIYGTTINLMPTDDPGIFIKTVILYDQADYLIKTPLDSFLLGAPCIWDGYGDKKTKVINDSQSKDILVVSDYLKFATDSSTILSYYLETGKCLVLEKKSKKTIKTILFNNYSEGKAMQSYGGRRFYIKNKLFLQTVEWTSK
jgi:hypothetical protein